MAGESPNDQQQLAYHLWTQSTPGRLGQEELKRAFSALLAEVSRRGELILESATPAQRRVLFATAIPAGRPFIASSEQGLLLPYLSNALR